MPRLDLAERGFVLGFQLFLPAHWGHIVGFGLHQSTRGS